MSGTKKEFRKPEKQKQREEEKTKAVSGWKAFTAKASGKGIPKSSIFKSPEGVESRIGVTGSGMCLLL